MATGAKLVFRVHAVQRMSAGEAIIVTVYEPDPARWEDGFTKRRKP